MRRKRLSPEAYKDGIVKQDRAVLGRAITLIESTLPSDRAIADDLIQACMPFTGKSFRLGISGVPGVGKSTFIDSFGSLLVERGIRVAVLAIDPSSQQSKGSILGDKTRMNRLSHHPLAFIRPSPTSGTLGGVASKTRESLLLCEAAGFDVIIVETVGVGQSETAVRDMVDFFLLLMLPNAGDELQGIKKGIMEMADSIAINKSDGNFLPKAREAKATYAQALRLFARKESEWTPKVLLSSALEGKGMDEIWSMLTSYREKLEKNGYWEAQRRFQMRTWFEDSIKQSLLDIFYKEVQAEGKLEEIYEQINTSQISPIQAARSLIETWRNS
ncbi:MAG: methylmalonyl Co-A mutase-associated GTPase MeaB [Bacteroidota bacterium]